MALLSVEELNKKLIEINENIISLDKQVDTSTEHENEEELRSHYKTWKAILKEFEATGESEKSGNGSKIIWDLSKIDIKMFKALRSIPKAKKDKRTESNQIKETLQDSDQENNIQFNRKISDIYLQIIDLVQQIREKDNIDKERILEILELKMEELQSISISTNMEILMKYKEATLNIIQFLIQKLNDDQKYYEKFSNDLDEIEKEIEKFSGRDEDCSFSAKQVKLLNMENVVIRKIYNTAVSKRIITKITKCSKMLNSKLRETKSNNVVCGRISFIFSQLNVIAKLMRQDNIFSNQEKINNILKTLSSSETKLNSISVPPKMDSLWKLKLSALSTIKIQTKELNENKNNFEKFNKELDEIAIKVENFIGGSEDRFLFEKPIILRTIQNIVVQKLCCSPASKILTTKIQSSLVSLYTMYNLLELEDINVKVKKLSEFNDSGISRLTQTFIHDEIINAELNSKLDQIKMKLENAAENSKHTFLSEINSQTLTMKMVSCEKILESKFNKTKFIDTNEENKKGCRERRFLTEIVNENNPKRNADVIDLQQEEGALAKIETSRIEKVGKTDVVNNELTAKVGKTDKIPDFEHNEFIDSQQEKTISSIGSEENYLDKMEEEIKRIQNSVNSMIVLLSSEELIHLNNEITEMLTNLKQAPIGNNAEHLQKRHKMLTETILEQNAALQERITDLENLSRIEKIIADTLGNCQTMTDYEKEDVEQNLREGTYNLMRISIDGLEDRKKHCLQKIEEIFIELAND